jgi:AraC family transcriptional regulator
MVAVMPEQKRLSRQQSIGSGTASKVLSANTGARRKRSEVLPLEDRSWSALQHYVENRMGDVIRLEDMAQTAYISRFHFARRFRARAGMSPMDYVMTRRIEMAKEKLVRTDTSICTVAHELGFFDQSHFCRTFCRRVGITPGEYRAQTAVQHAK